MKEKKEYKCVSCNKSFSSEESLKQHNQSKHSLTEKTSKNAISKRNLVFLLLALIVIFSILTIYSYYKKPGKYDSFAKCLSEKGVTVYGNDFCSYTMKQLGYFGKSKKYLNYIRCSENEQLCDEKGIKITPTWEINGKMYEQVQTFERLSELSGCSI